jgi:hypothetical protein
VYHYLNYGVTAHIGNVRQVVQIVQTIVMRTAMLYVRQIVKANMVSIGVLTILIAELIGGPNKDANLIFILKIQANFISFRVFIGFLSQGAL